MIPTAIFKPSNVLTFDTVQENRQLFMTALKAHTMDTIGVNLCDVHVCDSAGLALLLEVKRLCLAHQKKLSLIDVPPVVNAWVEFCGLKNLL